MLKKLLLTISLLSVLTLSTLAQEGGGTSNPGALPTPTPSPTPCVGFCPEGSNSSTAVTDEEAWVIPVFFNGVLYVITLG